MSRRLCYTFGALLGIAIAPLAVMLFDRREPVTLNFFEDEHCQDHCRGEIVPYYSHAGDTVTINWPIVENRFCDGTYVRVVKELRTGKIHFFDNLPVAYSTTLSKDRKWFSKHFTLPQMSPGPAIYWTVGSRWCNFMQKHIWPIPFRGPDIPFEVLPDGSDKAIGSTKGGREPPGEPANVN